MRRSLLTVCVVATAVIVGIIVSALGNDGTALSGPAGARHRAFSDVDPRLVAPGAAAYTTDVQAASSEKAPSASRPAKSSEKPKNDPPDGDLPGDLPDPDDALCSTAEREAIETTADAMRDDILDEAEADKADLLDKLGLGGLLGGVPDSAQDKLDAIDASAQDELDEVEALVADAIEECEAGGDALSAF